MARSCQLQGFPGDGTTSQPLQEPRDDTARATLVASGAALLDLFV